MEQYPEDVQRYIDILNEYTINKNLTRCNIVHLYPKEIAYPNGYFDSRFFNLHCFNTITMEKRIIEERDGLKFAPMVQIDIVRIYADKSTFIRFNKIYTLDIFQVVSIGEEEFNIEIYNRRN